MPLKRRFDHDRLRDSGGAAAVRDQSSARPFLKSPIRLCSTATQPARSFVDKPIVEIAGAGLNKAGPSVSDGLSLAALVPMACAIYGLAITGFLGAGIVVQSDSNIIQGNFIGTDSTRHATGLGKIWGVYIDGGSNNIIGRITAIPGSGPGNVLSGKPITPVF